MTLPQTDRRPDAPRVLGQVGGERPGPTLIGVGALHGNEPAGVTALSKAVARLREHAGTLGGEFLALRGNCAALATGQRFIAHDLNRHWTPERVASLASAAGQPAGPEDAELVAVWHEITRAAQRARGPVIVVDLHTTSGDSPPCATIGDTLTNRRLALALPIPVILGMEEQLDGTLLEYLSSLGYVTLGLEGGRHDDPASAERLEAALWIVLHAVGITGPAFQDEVTRARATLTSAATGLPRVVEVRYRHPVRPGDGFRMRPGFASFQPIALGQLLADDRAGPVAAPQAGRLLMPLYQRQGDDGFFVIREFRAFWLTVSAGLRRLGTDRIAHWLPGVHRDPARPNVLSVDRRVARWFALQIFHLLGFRKVRRDGPRLILSRRREPGRSATPG